MTFASDLKRFADKAKKRPQQVQRAVFMELSRRIIQRTPVDTGRARGNWQPTIDSPSLTWTENTDKSGSGSIANTVLTAAGVGRDQALFLTNNLPYIGRLEYGHSQQAPTGMVRISAQEFQQVVTVTVRGLNG